MRSLSPRLEHSRSPPPLHRRSISPRRSRSPSYDRNGGRRATRSLSRSPSPDVKSTKIVVERLTKNINENHLRELFGSFGEIIDMDMPMNRQFGTNRGTAYLLYAVEADADQAIAHMHEAQLDGAVISVSIVIPRRKFSPAPPLARRGANIEPRARMDARGPPPPRRRSPNRNYNRGVPSDTYRPRSLSRSRQGLQEGAAVSEIMKTVMGLGGEVRVTAATAAIAAVAEAWHVRTGREDEDRWERESEAALPRFTSPGEQEAGNTVVHIMTSNATPKPEAPTAFHSKLSKTSTAAPALITTSAPHIPGTVDGPQESPVTPAMTHTEDAKALELSPSNNGPSEAPAAKISNEVAESSKSETSPVVADVEGNSGPVEPFEDSSARTTRRLAISPLSAGKPYRTGIQVPSQVRVTDGFPYPPGLTAYEILEEDWNNFTAHLTSLISPHGKRKKNSPIRLVPPFRVRGEKVDFDNLRSKVFEYVRTSQNNLFLPKGLLMRVDVPGEGVGMEFMDLYHERHVDNLSHTRGTEASEANAAPTADGGVINIAVKDVVVQASVAETSLQHKKTQDMMNKAQDKMKKVQYKINKAQDKINKTRDKTSRVKDKTIEKARKQEERVLGHLNIAKKKISKRIRIVIEPVTVLENAERSEKNGWTSWVRHCDNYGSQLTD
ncbi:hypothetical protein V493_04278 [Pseudogymnoascus sp. VKM F-4281 (FW-2241)]|nr:hypothetical protein V493_04278 [Pseudogymnoascus sp. VKM F-4281 (FW-2241)]